MSGENEKTLVELGKIGGKLDMMMQMMQQNHADTNRRIDDLRTAQDARINSVEGRVKTLETNERSTAIKAGVAGTISGAIVAGAIAMIKLGAGR
jgi:hypothetical protein